MPLDLRSDLNSDSINDIIFVEHLISIGCSSWIICSYLRFEELRTPGFTLVLLLTLCDAAANVCYICFPPPDSESAECYAQAILVSFFVAASVLWSMVISLTIYATVLGALGRPARFLRSCLDRPLKVHAGVWGWSLAVALLPLSTNSTGHDAGPLCWLSTESVWGEFWVYFTAYGLIWFTIGVVVLVSCKIRFEILAVVSLMAELDFKDKPSTASSNKATDVQNGYARLLMFYNTLKWYPVILIVAWSPSTMLRVSQSFGYTMSSTVGNIFKLVTGMFIQGVLNAAAFGFTPIVRKKWGELIAKAWTKASLTPVFETEGSISSGLRGSFAESLDPAQGNAESTDTSRVSEVQLPDTESWVLNPFVAGSSNATPAANRSPSDV